MSRPAIPALAAALRPLALSALVRIAGILVLLTLPAVLPVACVDASAVDAATLAAADSTPATPPGRVLDKKRIALPTGITLAYLELGAPSGETVVFLHGITDTSRSFYDTALELAALRPELRLLVLDQRGHGDSSMPDPRRCRSTPESCFRPRDLAADVISFLDALALDRVHVVGHSLGSLVAQELALGYPERLRRIVLVDTAPSLVGNPVLGSFLLGGLAEGSWKQALEAKGHRFPEDVYELTPLDADPEVESWMLANWVFEPTADPRLLREIAPETARVRIGTWIGAARALLDFDNRERLRGLTVPTLALWATQDPMFYELPQQRDLIASFESASRDCGLRFFWKQYGRSPLPASGATESDFGHNLHWGPAAQVAQDLASFLREDGEPTRDFWYADPADVRRVVTEAGAAKIVEGRPGPGGAAGAACRRADAATGNPPARSSEPREPRGIR